MKLSRKEKMKRPFSAGNYAAVAFVACVLVVATISWSNSSEEIMLPLTRLMTESAEDSIIAPLVTERAEDTPQDGWKAIHVFYGNPKHLRPGRIAKSQTGQDELVVGLLKQKKHGFFVDLAANDATQLSNTYQLEQKYDWNGLCVEPNDRYWRGLSYRKCSVVAAVAGKERLEEVKFVMHEGARAASGGIQSVDFDNDPNKPKTNAVPVPLFTVPLLEILDKFHSPRVMDYLSLDIEGAEYFVMKDFPYNSYRFKVLTVERPKQELVNLLYDNGYRYLAGNNEWGMETLWVHETELDEIDEKAIDIAGWLKTDTKWMQIGKNPVHDVPTVVWKD